MDNPFFRQTLDETGSVYEEEVPRDSRERVIPEGVMAQSFPMDRGEPVRAYPVEVKAEVGPQGLPQVGPKVDDTPLTDAEIDRQIAELTAAVEGDAVERNPEFVEALKGVENSVKAGYSEDTGKWTPHSSLEGGTDTLGYGHKLTAAETKSGKVKIGDTLVDYRDGLTDEEVDALMTQDMEKAEKRLEGIRGYKDFPQKYKDILTNISFNIGRVNEKSWPKLFKAMRAGDDNTVRQEMVTSYKDKDGNRQQLAKRAEQIAKSVGLD